MRPATFVLQTISWANPRIKLPDWVKNKNLDPTIYPLHPSIPKSRRSVANLERFISFGIAEQSPGCSGSCLSFLFIFAFMEKNTSVELILKTQAASNTLASCRHLPHISLSCCPSSCFVGLWHTCFMIRGGHGLPLQLTLDFSKEWLCVA